MSKEIQGTFSLDYPMMQEKEVECIKNILQEHPSNFLSILEWGSGGSTIYFPRFLRLLQRKYKWTSIEYNRAWYARVSKLVADDPHTEVVLIDVGNLETKQRDNAMNDYVAYPYTQKEKYDVILVDGRKRRRCILAARDLLSSNGVVLLHDAQRRYYHCAFKEFPDSRMITQHLWRGKLSHPPIWLRMVNTLYYWWFYLVTTVKSQFSRAKKLFKVS
ncbi:MAG: hypothetical protein WDZ70_01945 [Candidatus Paceibacterota bacterium]